MEIKGTTTPVASSQTTDAGRSAPDLRVGQVLQALVKGSTPDGLFKLQLGHGELLAQSRLPLQTGQQLSLRVDRAGPMPELKLLLPLTAEALKASTLRQVLPRMLDLAPALDKLLQVGGRSQSQPLPRDTQQALRQLTDVLVTAKTAISPQGLREAVQHSGLFPEAMLARGQKPGQNVKTALLGLATRLRAATGTKGSTAPPPPVRITGDNKPAAASPAPAQAPRNPPAQAAAGTTSEALARALTNKEQTPSRPPLPSQARPSPNQPRQPAGAGRAQANTTGPAGTPPRTAQPTQTSPSSNQAQQAVSTGRTQAATLNPGGNTPQTTRSPQTPPSPKQPQQPAGTGRTQAAIPNPGTTPQTAQLPQTPIRGPRVPGPATTPVPGIQAPTAPKGGVPARNIPTSTANPPTGTRSASPDTALPSRPVAPATLAGTRPVATLTAAPIGSESGPKGALLSPELTQAFIKAVMSSARSDGTSKPRGQTPAPDPGLPRLMQELSRQAEGALSRIQYNQLASLPQEDPNRQIWQLDLPLRNGNRLDAFHLRIEEERNGAEQSAEGASWTINLEFELSPLGPIQVRVGILGETVSGTFWAQRRETANLISRRLEELQTGFERVGLEVGKLKSLVGTRPDLKPAATESPILDEKA